MTAGGHGAAYCFRATGNNGNSGMHKGFVPVLQVKVADTTGAGDAFLSGFLYSMVKVCLHHTVCLTPIACPVFLSLSDSPAFSMYVRVAVGKQQSTPVQMSSLYCS